MRQPVVEGVYGYALGPGPRSASSDWDAKAPSPLTREGIAQLLGEELGQLRGVADVEVVQAPSERGARGGQVGHAPVVRPGGEAGQDVGDLKGKRKAKGER